MTKSLTSVRKGAAWLVALVATFSFAIVPAMGQARAPQQREGSGDLILDAGGVAGTPNLDLTQIRRQAGFNLYGAADAAGAGLHGTGNLSYAIDNYGPCDSPLSGFCAWNVHPARSPGAATFSFFEVLYFAGAPPSQRAKIAAAGAPSVMNATGGGYTALMNFGLFAGRAEWGPRDLTLAKLFSGVPSTDDGGCRDNTGFGNGYYPTGLPLLATSNCTDTWAGGVWGGDRLIGNKPGEGWYQYWNDDPAGFNFDYWRVADSYKVTTSPFMGNNFSTYGESSDHYEEILNAYGNVIPGGTGTPGFQGYPLGLVWRFEAFNFGLPALSGVTFIRYTVINRSEDVYGVGVDYDSLYLGFAPGTGGTGTAGGQRYSDYYDPSISTAFYHESGSGSPNYCSDGSRAPSGVSTCAPAATDLRGYNNGGNAIIVLKSPIGDLRNKLYTRTLAGSACTPGTDPFCDPANAARGDTITFNHGHICGYGGCWATTHNVNDRRSFGMISSTEGNVLDGRAIGSLSNSENWLTFRSAGFPGSGGGTFNRWVPGSTGPAAAAWDWNHDGISDTLFYDTCHTNGCVVEASDTMPGGQINAYGNVGGVLAAGPVALAAGDSTSWYVAFVGELDSTRTYSAINQAITAYMTFYLLPESPPPARILSTQVTTGSDFDLRQDPSVTLYFSEDPEKWVDPYLASQAATQTDPTLKAELTARASDNLAAIEIYKSCDGGNTFTSDANCDGDPATDAQGNPIGFGWEAYATIERDKQPGGDIPNAFTDNNVVAGKSYLYVFIGRSRGATFLTITSGAPDSIQFAPPISNPLSRSTADPNVASVYIPASRQAGATTASATFSETGLGSTVPFNLSFTDNVTAGTYVAQFGNRITVERDSSISGAAPLGSRVTVEYLVSADTGGVMVPNVVVNSSSYTRAGATEVPVAGSGTTTTAAPGDTVTTTTVYSGLGFVVSRAGTAYFATTTLTGAAATPTGLLAVPDFPGFSISADNSVAGSYNTSEVATYGPNAATALGVTEGDTIPRGTIVNPRLPQWREQTSGVTAYGRGQYVLTWTDEAFGLPNGVQLNVNNPSATEAEFDAALESRGVGLTGLTDTITANLLAVDQGDLVPVRVPFTVHNATYDRDVSVAMVKRLSDRFLLGTGQDTARINIPSDAWVPGDHLVFMENVQEDSVGASGGVVLSGGLTGTPIQVTHRRVTFSTAVIGCDSPREGCNPVGLNSLGFSGGLPVYAGDEIHFEYYAGFKATSRYTWDLVAPTRGDDITLVTDSAMGAIQVVPNPYIVYSAYQTDATTGMVMFTNLPPAGLVRIYTVSGQFVQQIDWTSADLNGAGDLFYDLKSREGIDIATGLYIWVVTAPSDPTNPASTPVVARGKFVVIRGNPR